MATIKDVAKKAGVTVTTVSRMLNDRVKVSDKTKNKILQAMEELNYEPNEVARSLIKKNNKIIGIIVASASNYFLCKVIEEVEKWATFYGYKLLVCVSNHETQKEIEYFKMLKANKVAGVVLASHTQELENYINFDAPIISFDRSINEYTPSVSSDNYQGGVLAAKHLVEKGCKNLYFFSDINLSGMYANLRYDGFKDILKENNIEAKIYLANPECFISMDYEKEIEQFFYENKEVDGIFASNDIIATQIIAYCKKNNINVPKELKVVGFDGIDLVRLVYPKITTIRQPVEENCRFAVEAILGIKDEEVPKRTLFPVELILGEST